MTQNGKARIRSAWRFQLMALVFKLRDWYMPPERILDEPGITEGMTVLDFGCGPGSFTIAAAKRIGAHGTVHALDILPLALETVRRAAERLGLRQVRTISDCANIKDQSIDVALLYDILHEIETIPFIFEELHRVLKPNGILSVSDHHQKAESITAKICCTNKFALIRKDRHSMQFSPIFREGESA
jgi:ubiquinone/menaquinone biosynthesis C-methylase UbiE